MMFVDGAESWFVPGDQAERPVVNQAERPAVNLAIMVMVLCYVATLAWQHRRYRGEPPIVFSWLPFVGSAFDFGYDAYSFVCQQRQQLGDVFVAVVGGRRMIFVCDEKAANRAVHRNKDLSFHAVERDILRKVFGMRKRDCETYITEIDDKVHAQYRRCLLKMESLDDLTATASRTIDGILEKQENSKGVDLYEIIKAIVFEATVEVLFGPIILGPDPMTLLRVFEELDESFPVLAGGAPSRKGSRARKLLASRFLLDYQKDTSKLMEARVELFRELRPQPSNVNDGEVALQTSHLWGTVANTMPATFWVLYHLLQRKDWIRRVQSEVQASSATDDWSFLENAVAEALRLSSGSVVLRDAIRPSTITTSTTTFHLRRGDRVCVFPPLAHLDPIRFPNPTSFDPDRNTTFRPQAFGAGLSMCPGRKFAIREIKLVVAKLLSRFDINLIHPNASPPGLRPVPRRPWYLSSIVPRPRLHPETSLNLR